MGRSSRRNRLYQAAVVFLVMLAVAIVTWNVGVFSLFLGIIGFLTLTAAIFVPSRRHPHRRWRRIAVGLIGIALILASGWGDFEGWRFLSSRGALGDSP